MDIEEVKRKVMLELERAEDLFPAMLSNHEGYAIIKEEFDELWDEIKKKGDNNLAIESEAIQVAAMVLRFLKDCC